MVMRVLLVDDQAWLRSALRLFLEYEPNIEVVGEAGNAQTLPGLIASLHPDLLLLDGELTDIKSNSARRCLITALRAVQPALYVIVLSGNHEVHGFRLTTGADAYVSKTEPPDRLLTALRLAEASRLQFNHQQLAV
jgi:DNA-binding NarL/FixJ family response regulator